MTINQLQNQVEDYLGNAQISEAIDAILAFADQNRLRGVRQNALLLRAQITSLKQKYEIRGMLNHQDYQVEANRIASGVLDLTQAGIEKDQSRQQTMRWVIPLAVVILSALGFWIYEAAMQKQSPQPNPASNTPIQSPAPAIRDSIHRKDTLFHPVTGQHPDSGTAHDFEGLKHKKPETATGEKITIRVNIDDYWQGAEIWIDGRPKGTISTYSKSIQLNKKEGDYKIILRKEGKESAPEFYSAGDDRSVNFTHE